jgi:hypothetical protein
MNFFKTSFLCLVVLLLSSVSYAQTWTNLGPKGSKSVAGVMRELDLHQTSNKLFASSPDGGLWVSDLKAASPSWSPISDYLDNIEVRAFAVAPSDKAGNVIYLANKSYSLYRTDNGGGSWTKLTNFNSSFGRVNKILVSNDNFNVVYLAPALFTRLLLEGVCGKLSSMSAPPNEPFKRNGRSASISL